MELVKLLYNSLTKKEELLKKGQDLIIVKQVNI